MTICTIACSSIKDSRNSYGESNIPGPYILNDKLIMGTAPQDTCIPENDSFNDRKIIFRNTKKAINGLTNFNFELNFLFCVDRAGEVTYLEYLEEESTANLNNKDLPNIMKGLATYRCEPDSTAAEHQCGKYKFKIDLNRPSDHRTINNNCYRRGF